MDLREDFGLLTTAEVASELGCSEGVARQLVETRTLKSRTVDGVDYVAVGAVQGWKDSHRERKAGLSYRRAH